ncbi:hypothetical protein E1293_20680 [Actinomadura darangshiensis]|uniref:Probable transposase IS891/IS1136/IS1341 domain-containing protein n=1 Tax=Actinomadura darangshiensis TaxID=705336 RepID=A0A4R5B6N0_9ACTN|nr:hypothetical protein E1293_20680 [Actinomadura darangshiensis]
MVRVEPGPGRLQRHRYDTEGKWWSGTGMHRLWNRVRKTDPALGSGGVPGSGSGVTRVRQVQPRGTQGPPLGFSRRFRNWPAAWPTARRRSCRRRCRGPPTTDTCRSPCRSTVPSLPACPARQCRRRRPPDHHAADRRRRPGRRDRDRRTEGAAGRAAQAVAAATQQGALAQAAGSANRAKAAARLARHHARNAELRKDALHKATGRLAARCETVVVENHNVSGTMANRRPCPRRPRPRRRRGRGRRPRVRAGTADAGLQDRLERREPGGRRPLVPLVQDVLGLRRGESPTRPVRAHLPMRH